MRSDSADLGPRARSEPAPSAARDPVILRPDTPALTPPPGFAEAASALGVEFDPGDTERLGRYLALLLEANETTNLTAVTDPTQAWTRHILDSLTLIPLLAELPDGASVIDVGSGGGLPGIPLAICMPHLRFTLLEATGKKAAFLRAAATILGLANAHVLPERAEQAAHDRGEKATAGSSGGHREAYDAVTARAVGRLATLAELTVPFAKVGGHALLIKGQAANEELKEAEKALHLLKAVHTGTIDTPTGRIVILEKRSATPRTYPRRDGEPKRAPLGV